MKKQIFTLALLAFFSSAYAQQSLKDLISGENGISNHFLRLEAEDQRVFNPKQARDALSLDPLSDLVLQSTETDQSGFIHYRYFQTYRNIPVENSMFIAHIQSGKLVGLSGEIVTEFDNTIKSRGSAAISSKQAIEAAINYVHAKKYAWQNAYMEKSLKEQKSDAGATYYPQAKLVWFSETDNINSRNLRMAYKVDVHALVPFSSAYYFIDAQTGQVLGTKSRVFFTDATGTANTTYSGTRTIHSDLNGSTYRLRDLTKGNGIVTLNNGFYFTATDYTSPSANWNLTGNDQAAMDAHYGVSQTYLFYKANFNRNSYDNKGAVLTSHVNNPLYTDNAFWDAASLTMNFCKSSKGPGGVTGIDVTGHELTHAVTQLTSALVYSKEPGAMNESMSDIMGKSVQFWSKPTDTSWMISNDMNWIIRNMANPNEQKQPDTYKGTYWVTSSDDSYGVHTNSGVGNFMFYLLVMGGSGTNDLNDTYTVKGIGLAKADQVLYRTNTTYLTPNSQYADWRIACINAAKDLYPGDTALLSSVINAWYAVGIGKSATSNSCAKPAELLATNITNTGADINWSSPDAISYNLRWKNLSDSTSKTIAGIKRTSYHLAGLMPNTTYEIQVKSLCLSATSGFSKVKTFFTSPPADTVQYCASSGFFSLLDYIDKVVLSNVNNTSGSNGGYGDYTGLTAVLNKGVVNKIKLTPGFLFSPYEEYWTMFIDYNHDGDFADQGERVLTAHGPADITKPFTVPAAAQNGFTRLRIQMTNAGSSSIDPCATFFANGEVEDYKVKISDAPAITPEFAFGIADEHKEASVKVSPNPVTGSGATVSYTVAKTGKVAITLMDFYGRAMQTIPSVEKAAGTYTFSLDNVKKLLPGTYMIAVYQDNAIAAKTSFIVIR